MALMWKAAGGVKVSSTKLEASLPTAVSQRKRVHSFWKVPPGTRAWMDTTAKTQPPYHMLHDLRGNTHIHIWVSTSERLSGLLMTIIARIVPAPPFLPISPSKPLPKIYFLFVPSLLLSQSLLAIIYRNLSTRLWLIRLLWWNSLLHHTGLIKVDIFFPKWLFFPFKYSLFLLIETRETQKMWCWFVDRWNLWRCQNMCVLNTLRLYNYESKVTWYHTLIG